MNLKEATKNKCCCNCKHNRRVEGKNGISCICDKDGRYIGYIQCFEFKCDYWEDEE